MNNKNENIDAECHFSINVIEQGFIIMVLKDKLSIIYTGDNDTEFMRFKKLTMNVQQECLEKLTLFKSDEEVIPIVNKYRDAGYNAHILSVFKESIEMNRTIGSDDTKEYFKLKLINKVNKKKYKC